jgi:uncharacterized membrane protein YdfJ with MMPL/SSD domain
LRDGKARASSDAKAEAPRDGVDAVEDELPPLMAAASGIGIAVADREGAAIDVVAALFGVAPPTLLFVGTATIVPLAPTTAAAVMPYGGDVEDARLVPLVSEGDAAGCES